MNWSSTTTRDRSRGFRIKKIQQTNENDRQQGTLHHPALYRKEMKKLEGTSELGIDFGTKE